ncbi:MAG TPA: SpoIID/LytB domain-containing protein, partial [Gemmatimonadaceae bacterium]|nr:SpoIID/LytB domain-containing protein [Gemmatimonadaceae bacterium]
MSCRLPTSFAFLSLSFLAVACGDLDPVSPAARSGLSRTGIQASSVADGQIRIGVVQSATSITLGSASDWTITDKASGVVLFTGNGGGATVSFAAAPPAFYRLQVVCGNAATIATRRAAADAAGYITLTEFVPAANCTRLFLGEFAPPPASNFTPRNNFRNAAIAAGHAANDSFWKVVALGAASYRVTLGSNMAETTNPVVVTSSSGLITINGATYRGRGEAGANGSGTMAGVNQLPIEQYLYGVVPRELGPIAYPEVEAQKAQAVAARTYAVAGFGRRGSDGYDLRATTDDQVYGGYAVEHPVSSAAVDATAGMVATYRGALISALYSSTSGGHTADNEESFASAPVDYLRGIPDAQRGRALEHVPSLSVFKAHANPTSLRAAREGDFDSNWSSLHRWTFEWTNEEITAIVSTFAQTDVGRVHAIEAVERGPSGRILKLAYVTDAGTFIAEKFAIRSSLTFIAANGTRSALPST